MAGGVLQLLFVHEGLGSDEEGASEEERADRLLYAWPASLPSRIGFPPSPPPPPPPPLTCLRGTWKASPWV
ncbi:hypothetical protein NGA_0699100 [Nannochloropsis gaditana CCMP526]|uniref:uncharacterized protein n=1 Tax=Nannochloropsis gaditana (strain CCMP526) TaxID=1093141 RepID=UPI00029F4E94|nr:hypothetical protein NGA_0699100 [Nannochloropsis gaditana CCMP526]EKU23451.1 hypothetical protein NGA_0699100 [Nannochloropsis gaditana CCMP526]|eukprot:XP_005852376.1 hypothetical protein NGA_0699100 [Nannochloropsis gaditana CCMP526]